MEYRFIVTGGGTSGHINPAISIADALIKFYEGRGDSCKIIFTGRSDGYEGILVPKAGYELKDIEAKPFPMRPGPKLIPAFKTLKKGRAQCRKIISDFKPDAVIGTGGFVCAPLLLEASKQKVPVIIHEANAFPGRANKLIGKKADLVLTGFPGQESAFSGAGKVICVGNPVRDMMFGNTYEGSREKLGIAPDQKLVFAMGGSRGSKTINEFILKAAGMEEFKDVRFVLGAGMQQADLIPEDFVIPENLSVNKYIENPNDYLSAADVSITRAGAVTCAEVAAMGACSVFIPYPYAAHKHQNFNAQAFVDAGGALMVEDEDVCKGELFPVLKELLSDDEKRKNMRENALKLAIPDCNDRITKAIDSLLSNE
ncbi:MAG: undecaprenyldiphospho-muramoylpentapeptide beta-N-acetylglucosaminyltransferase [Clostridiales bacterium]|nr:undecaprenyldiphospho-muramoylpentapeptide beta-N-acetylglucosaminyltransferase [Clostridiales bacterium]